MFVRQICSFTKTCPTNQLFTTCTQLRFAPCKSIDHISLAMSNLEAVTKVADQIVSRLFDQRQFTSGEINYLFKELDERVKLDENFDRLLKINENVCVISDTSREDMCSAHDSARRNICDQVSSLVERSESLLRLEGDYRDRDELVLGAVRREMEQHRQHCVRECNAKLERLQESIVGEELELERKYLKFEENLRDK